LGAWKEGGERKLLDLESRRKARTYPEEQRTI